MSETPPSAPPRNHAATAAGITTVSLSFFVLMGSFGLWLLLILVMIVLAVFTCGFGLYAFPMAAMITAGLHALASLYGATLAALGIYPAWRSDYRGPMTTKAVACLLAHLLVAAATVCLLIWIAVRNPDSVDWLKSNYIPD
jgi:hypothetical protein